MHGIDIGVLNRCATDMQFKNDRLFPRDLGTTVVAPGEGRFDDPAFRDLARIIASVE